MEIDIKYLQNKEPIKLLPPHVDSFVELSREYCYLYMSIWVKLEQLIAKERDNQHKPSKTST